MYLARCPRLRCLVVAMAIACIGVRARLAAAECSFTVVRGTDESRFSPVVPTDPCTTCEVTEGSGRCSLRSAIESANLCPEETCTIKFDKTITTVNRAVTTIGQEVRGVPLEVQKHLMIDASDHIDASGLKQLVTIDLQKGGRGFTVREGASLTLKQVRIVNGAAAPDEDGGAVRALTGAGGTATVTLENCVLEQNRARRGGAVSGSGTVSETRIEANVAIDEGGGIYVPSGGTLDIVKSTIKTNEAREGCGIASLGRLTVSDSTVRGNRKCQGGGGIEALGAGTLDVRRSAVVENEAQVKGGGILVSPGVTATLENVTVAGNKARDGAGLVVENPSQSSQVSGKVTLRHVTIARNAGSDAGAGGGVVAEKGTAVSMGYCLLADNSPTNCDGGVQGTLFNLIEDDKAKDDPTPRERNNCERLQPIVVPGKELQLGALGGGEPPVVVLGSRSSARERIDGVAPDCTPGGCETDQLGVPRPQARFTENDPDKKSDVGAYEVPTPCPCKDPSTPRWSKHAQWKRCVRREVKGVVSGDWRDEYRKVLQYPGNEACGAVRSPGVDDDGDGVPNETDNCPKKFNPDQANSDVAEEKAGHERGDACDPNDDNDAYLDQDDRCPFLATKGNYDEDGDGVGTCCDDDETSMKHGGKDGCPCMAPGETCVKANEGG